MWSIDEPIFLCVQVAELILEGRELEFYKWDGELPQLLGAVKENLNKVAEVSQFLVIFWLLKFYRI